MVVTGTALDISLTENGFHRVGVPVSRSLPTHLPIWRDFPEMPELPAYALIWKKRSYGGHTGDETVIRIVTRVTNLVPIVARSGREIRAWKTTSGWKSKFATAPPASGS